MYFLLDANAINVYRSKCKNTLAKLPVDFDLMTCINLQCNNIKHKHTIDEMYCSVVHALEGVGHYVKT